MKILIAGDIHMDTSQVEYLIRMAKAEDCAVILCCGDFGYWPHTESGKKYLHKVERMLAEADLNLYWIDGNHENFDWLNKAIASDTFVKISQDDNFNSARIFYIPRGLVWEWDGVKFLGMGGAISIDKGMRTLGKSYWAQEALHEDDIKRGIEAAQNDSGELAGYHVDVLLCHDAPSYVNVPLDNGIDNYTLARMAKGLDTDTKHNRMLLNELVEAVLPNQIYHGHYHIRHSNPYSRPGLEIPCEGLNMNGRGEESWIVLDTEDWK